MSDELVERVALQAANRRRAVYRLVPLLDMSSVKEPSLSMLIDDARAALAIIEPAVREAIAAWHDEQAEGENALSVLAERDGDCGGERLHHHLANEHDASAAAIRAGAKP